MVSINRPCDVVVATHVSPRDLNPAFFGGDRRERFQQVASGSRQPVEPRHRQHVARLKLADQPAKLRPVGLGSARHYPEHLLCTRPW
jgi:hypothetical protein